MTVIKEYLRTALRYALLRDTSGTDRLMEASDDELKSLYRLALSQDLGHIVAYTLTSLMKLPSGELGAAYSKQYGLAIYRTSMIETWLSKVSCALSEIGVKHIPLKGSVIRGYYPEPWMRTSCDIDILIKHEDLDRATKHLIASLGMRSEGRHVHDVSLYTEDNVHLELHFSLMEQGSASDSYSVLDNVWDHATASQGSEYVYSLDDAVFYLYHIAHAARHLEKSGSGIRAVIDLYYLDNLPNADVAARDALLKETGLYTVASCMRTIADAWLGEGEYTDLAKELEDYMLENGIYGEFKNSVALMYNKKTGKHRKLRYILSRIFLPYRMMKYAYPILERMPILLPFCHLHRWIGRILHGRLGHGLSEISIINSFDDEKLDAKDKLIKNLGL